LAEQSQAFIAVGKIETAVVLLQAAIEKGFVNGSIRELLAECRAKIQGSAAISEPDNASSSFPRQPAGLEGNAATV
jgi:hypothetical protein